MTVITRRATLEDLGELVPLFAQYRTFYGQPQDPETARRFLYDRLSRNDSTIFIAHIKGLRDGAPVGFTQLYPLFSSVRAARVFLLNDLFVAEHARRSGVALALLSAAVDYGQREGAIRLDLETMPDNHAAQALYRTQGWREYDGTLRFQLPLAPGWSDDA